VKDDSALHARSDFAMLSVTATHTNSPAVHASVTVAICETVSDSLGVWRQTGGLNQTESSSYHL